VLHSFLNAIKLGRTIHFLAMKKGAIVQRRCAIAP
jgi:hypothetical protein